jgi:glycosyltransferase involved in cell wall biosynthesis
MRVIQLLPTLAYGDAVGNDTIAIKKILKDMGYDTQIYAESITPSLLEKGIGVNIAKLPRLEANDVLIYHLSTGSELNYKFAEFKGRKIAVYHNVTPPEFFQGYDYTLEQLTQKGLDGVRFLESKVDYCLADSEFNKENLTKIGYKVPIDILPIVVPFDDYKKKPSQDVLEKYQDDKHNIIFAGRVAPNKCHQDIIAAFACYKKYYDSEARLFLVGSYQESDTYYRKLKRYVELLEVEDVVFTGHITFEEILAYYRIADAFLCMSEHEGFCVPLVEAMFFGIPIIAYNCTAVPLTLGDGGILVNKKDPIETAALINRIISDKDLREIIRKNQKMRLEEFRYEKIAEMFRRYLKNFLEHNGC